VRRPITLLVCALALATPVTAWGQQTNAPPGNSGVDEYLESVPGATGDRPSGGIVNRKPQPLSARERQALRDAGSDAQALERVVGATKPEAAGTEQRRAGRTDSPAGGAGSEGESAQGRSPLAAVVEAATGADDDGLGLLLPAILLGALLAALAVLVVRLTRRRSAS